MKYSNNHKKLDLWPFSRMNQMSWYQKQSNEETLQVQQQNAILCIVSCPFITRAACDVYINAVIATATWLAGWVAGCLSHAGIVSKWLKLS